MRDHLLVMAKAPVAGRSKTRLCPPCSPAQAAEVAEAALADVLDAVAACGASRKLLALDGEPGPWLPEGYVVFAQEGHSFNDRLAHAWSVADGPGVQVGMDTPQVRADDLDAAQALLLTDGVDAVLGAAADGGWWAIGLRRPDARVFAGIPMSQADTCHHQRQRLESLGLRTTTLPTFRDIDYFDDALAVASAAPHLRTAATVRAIEDLMPRGAVAVSAR